MHEVKIIRKKGTDLSVITKVYYNARSIRLENNKHPPHTAVLPFVDFYIAFDSHGQSSIEFFVSIHLLLIFDCPFFVDQGVVSV